MTGLMRAVGETTLGIHYRTDPDAVERRLPEPLESIRRGEVFVYVTEAVINDTDQRSTPATIDPYTTSFRQLCVTLPCECGGTEGTYFTYHRVDGDTQLRTVRAMGYDSEVADVHLTRFPPELREFASPGPGRRVSGTVTAGGETIVSADVDIERAGDASDLPWPFVLTVFSHRSIPDEAAGTGRERLADDVLVETHESESISNVWLGEPTLEVAAEALADLYPEEVLGGYYFDIELVLGGLERVATGG